MGKWVDLEPFGKGKCARILPTMKPLYRFETIDYSDFVPEETDEPNIYGEVIRKKGELRVRYDGTILSFWKGRQLILTFRWAD